MKYSIIAFLAISFLISCSKKEVLPSQTQSTYYMKFKVDDTLKTFIYTTAYFFGGPNSCALNGGTNDSTGNAMTINLYNSSEIISNTTYTETEIVPAAGSYVPKCYLAYAINNPSAYNFTSWIANNTEHSVYKCSVQILEIDSNHVKGRFSGKIRKRLGTNFSNITEGEFNIKR